MRALQLAMIVIALLVSACDAGSSASPSPSAASFSVEVVPPETPVEVRAAIPGQKTCFLVTVSDEAGGGPVTVSATASGATVDRIAPTDLAIGEVGEVWLTTDPTITTDTTASVSITVTRDGASQTVDRSILVMPMSGEGREAEGQPYFEYWVAWLEAEHPELGISADTEWEPMFVSTLLIVSKMAYYADEWEMVVQWHVMIPPSDFSEIYLRRRGTESRPSLAFKLDSFQDGTPPYAIEPPEVVIR